MSPCVQTDCRPLPLSLSRFLPHSAFISVAFPLSIYFAPLPALRALSLSRSNTLLPVCSARSPHLKINLHAAATTTTAATQQLLRQCPVPPSTSLSLSITLAPPHSHALFTTYNSNKATASLRLVLPACLRAKFHFPLPCPTTCCCFLSLALTNTALFLSLFSPFHYIHPVRQLLQNLRPKAFSRVLCTLNGSSKGTHSGADRAKRRGQGKGSPRLQDLNLSWPKTAQTHTDTD